MQTGVWQRCWVWVWQGQLEETDCLISKLTCSGHVSVAYRNGIIALDLTHPIPVWTKTDMLQIESTLSRSVKKTCSRCTQNPDRLRHDACEVNSLAILAKPSQTLRNAIYFIRHATLKALLEPVQRLIHTILVGLSIRLREKTYT